MKIFVAIILVLVILWSGYSMFLIVGDRADDEIVIIARIYWWLILIAILFILSYGFADKIIK